MESDAEELRDEVDTDDFDPFIERVFRSSVDFLEEKAASKDQ